MVTNCLNYLIISKSPYLIYVPWKDIISRSSLFRQICSFLFIQTSNIFTFCFRCCIFLWFTLSCTHITSRTRHSLSHHLIRRLGMNSYTVHVNQSPHHPLKFFICLYDTCEISSKFFLRYCNIQLYTFSKVQRLHVLVLLIIIY